MTSGVRLLACLLVAWGTSVAQTQGSGRTPSLLPGKGLAEHDFLYAGESHERRIFLVRQGKVVWSYDDPADKGEVSDAVMLSNRNVLFAHQFGVTEITPDKKVVWNYDTPTGHEVHTAMPIGKDRVFSIQNGNPAELRVVNIVTHAAEHEITLQTRHPDSTHVQFRHARLTNQGTWIRTRSWNTISTGRSSGRFRQPCDGV